MKEAKYKVGDTLVYEYVGKPSVTFVVGDIDSVAGDWFYTPEGSLVSYMEDACRKIEHLSAKNKYSREIKPNVFVDVYDVLKAFNVTDPCLQHLVKKALAVGQRGHKDAGEDYKDILDSAKRAEEMFKEGELYE